MTFFDWLGTSQGTELAHAVLVFLNILGVWLAHRASNHSKRVEKRLDVYVKAIMQQIHGGHEHC